MRIVVRAFNNLSGHRWAAILSVAGIALGIMAVIIVGSLGAGTQKDLTRNMELLGSNILTVSPGKFKKIAKRKRKEEVVNTLINHDAEEIKNLSAKIMNVAPIQYQLLDLKAGRNVMTTAVIGTTPDYQTIKNINLEKGRFLNDGDNSDRKKYVVLGNTVAEKLFKDENPVGNRVYIYKINFEVVGVVAKRGIDIGGNNEDIQVFIPLSTGTKRLFNMDYLQSILVQTKKAEQMKGISQQIESILRERHHLRDDEENDFLIQNQNELLQADKQSREEFSKMLFGVASFLLIVGGFGILSVMLISIKERTREIGLRRAIGARKSDILIQFLSEAVVLCFAGGVIGILMGLVSVKKISLWAGLPSSINSNVVLMPLIFSFVIGSVFGIYPAVKAARLSPITALRAQ